MALPAPSERNWEIYHEVAFEMRSHRDVADAFQIAASRVGEIIKQVQRWLKENAVDWAIGLSPKLQVMLAWRTYGERALHAGQKLMEAWRNSCSERIVKRQGSGLSPTVTVTSTSYGDPRYMTHMLKVARIEIEAAEGLAKLPASWYAEIRAERDAQQALSPSEPSPPTGGMAQEEEEDDEVDEVAASCKTASEFFAKVCAPLDRVDNLDPDVLTTILAPGRAPVQSLKSRKKELARKLKQRQQRGKIAS